jgi:uncharacterized protein with PIN domain
MKFIADSMLGRLARWLRLLGFDTSYSPHIEDDLLIKTAREEDRVLLTRDTRIVKRRGVKEFLLLEENDTFEQLKKVIETFDLLPEDREDPCPICFIRCSLCNSLLEDIPKEDAKPHVPEYVYQTSESFRKCPSCGKFYWRGTHYELLLKKLKDVVGDR